MSKEIFIFGKDDCAKCKSTKDLLHTWLPKWGLDNLSVTFFNTDEPRGRSRAAFYDVLEIPATLVRENGKEVARFIGKVPPTSDLKAALGVIASLAESPQTLPCECSAGECRRPS